jgi:hypothetical protein
MGPASYMKMIWTMAIVIAFDLQVIHVWSRFRLSDKFRIQIMRISLSPLLWRQKQLQNRPPLCHANVIGN